MEHHDEHELEQAFKKRLEEKGIPYFGPVAKHYLDDARGRKYPHAPRQQPHGRRPGKRTLMTGLRAKAKKFPNLDIPSWNEMLNMGHDEVLRLFEHHFGAVKPQGHVLRRVENDPHNAEGFNREEERAQSNAQTLPGAGKQGENLRVDQFPVTRMMENEKPVEPRQRLVPRRRKPGRDVVDYHEHGHANEATRVDRAGAGAPEARGPFNRNPESMVEAGRRPADRAPASPPRRLRRNRVAIRPAQGQRVENFDQKKQRAEGLVRQIPNGIARGAILQHLQRAKNDEDLARVAAEVRGAARQLEGGRGATNMQEHAPKLHAVADALDGKARAGETPVSPVRRGPAHAGTDRPDEAATRAAREAGVPKTQQFREMPTADRQQFREFHQNDKEIQAGLDAAKGEIERANAAGKKANALRVAGRYVDQEARNDLQANEPLKEELARAAAERALRAAGKALNRTFTEKEREKWVANLMERYNIRHRGKPEGDKELARAREIDRHEKFREGEDQPWQRGGRVRDRLKPAGQGQNDKPAQAARPAAPARPRAAARPDSGDDFRAVLREMPDVPRDTERAMVLKDVFENGEQKPTGKSVGGGVSGSMPIVQVEKDGNKAFAVKKPQEAGAAQEEFAANFIHALGGEHMMPVVARDSDNAALMEFVDGNVAFREGVYDVSGLRAQLVANAVRNGMGVSEAKKQADQDIEMMQVADYLLANDDRHGKNFMIDAKGRLQLIDNGLAGRGDLGIYQRGGDVASGATSPRLRAATQGKSRKALSPELKDRLGKLSREDVLRMAGNLLQQNPVPSSAEMDILEEAMSRSQAEAYRKYIVSEQYIDAIWARIEYLREHGRYSYRGV